MMPRCGTHSGEVGGLRVVLAGENRRRVSPDGEQFLMVKDETGSGRLNVVLNWAEDLKRQVPTR